MANQSETLAAYANPPRASHRGPNFMDGTYIATLTMSASVQAYMFKLPPDCYVIRAVYSGSVPSGTSGQAVLKLGTETTDNLFGTVTVSGGAATPKTVLWGPFTVSGSGSMGFHSVIATVNSAPSATTSLSLYLQLEYVLLGNLGS